MAKNTDFFERLVIALTGMLFFTVVFGGVIAVVLEFILGVPHVAAATIGFAAGLFINMYPEYFFKDARKEKGGSPKPLA